MIHFTIWYVCINDPEFDLYVQLTTGETNSAYYHVNYIPQCALIYVRYSKDLYYLTQKQCQDLMAMNMYVTVRFIAVWMMQKGKREIQTRTSNPEWFCLLYHCNHNG